VTEFQAFLLGFLQGLTEFLPISSTAHLTLAGKLFGIIDGQHTEAWTAFLAVVQLGTLAAVVVYFFPDLIRMIRAVMRDLIAQRTSLRFRTCSPDTRLAFLIVIGTIPIGLAGVLLSDILHGVLTKNLVVIASSLVSLAALLWVAERKARHTRNMEDLRPMDAITIGMAQCLALIPGSSRSGTTLTAGLFLNLTRHTAARFSFLLSIPAVLASGLHELFSLTADPFQFGMTNVIIAIIISALSGYAAIAWLLRFLTTRTTMVFVWYRFVLGASIGILLLLRMIQA
jgi:undecaprenyl-diphosphatase